MRTQICFLVLALLASPAFSQTINLTDGRTIKAEELCIKGGIVEYKAGGVPGLVSLDKVKSISASSPASPQRQPAPTTQLNPIAAIPEAKARQDLKAHLEGQYPDSYSTQKMLLDAGMRDYSNLCRMPSNQVSDGIMRKLSATYYPSFSTIWLLYKKNAQDYVELQKK